jgi:4-hydroxybenzoate polyprenyltransferase
MPIVGFLIKASRPRFWIYIFGPFIVGLAGAASNWSDLLRPEIAIFAIYFLFPANLLIYGVNDIFDYETDRLNPKKRSYEILLAPATHRSLWFYIALTNVPFLLAAVLVSPFALWSLAAFLFFSVFYSAPPVRAKEVPFLDSIFNILYVFPGAFGYQLLSGHFPRLAPLFAAGLWTAAMHAFSAIPDIDSDRAAGIETIATKLGAQWTIGFCMACYVASALVCVTFAPPLMPIGLVYLGYVRFSAYVNDFEQAYKWFPVLNTACGFLLFCYAVYVNFR